jgi:hypothetical protein
MRGVIDGYARGGAWLEVGWREADGGMTSEAVVTETGRA